MYVPKLHHLFGTSYIFTFPLWQFDNPQELAGGLSFVSGDCVAFSRTNYITTTFANEGNLTPTAVTGITGMYRVTFNASDVDKEEQFLRVVDLSPTKLWIDEIFRIQNFGSKEDGSSHTLRQDFGVTNPAVDIQAIAGDTQRAQDFGKVVDTWHEGVVDASPTPTTTAVKSTNDLLGGAGNAAVAAFRGRTMIFLDGDNAQKGTTIVDYDQATQLITFKQIEVAPLSTERFVIV